MNAIVMHIAREGPWSPVLALIFMGGKAIEAGAAMSAGDSSWLSVRESHSVIHDYDEEDLKKLRSLVGDAKSYLVEWRGDEILQNFISSIGPKQYVLIDNDHGLMASLADVFDLPVEQWVRQSRLPGGCSR